MLRRLMAWCVPDEALRLHTGSDVGRSARDEERGHALFVALASHGLSSPESGRAFVPDTTARDDRSESRGATVTPIGAALTLAAPHNTARDAMRPRGS